MNGVRLVMFPGLGMDGRTLEPQRGVVEEMVVPGWLRPERGETLERYAGRMAEGVRGDGRRLYLGGVSIGGAIALEVARRVRAEGVFLIASATTSRAIPNLLRTLGEVAPVVPRGVLRPFFRMAPPVVRFIMRGYPEAGRILGEAVREIDLEVWRWGARAIMRWELGGEVGCPVHAIHGDADVITPVYRVRPEVMVRGGGHMLNVTHADEVNSFIRERL